MKELKQFKREIRSIRPITLIMKRKVKSRTRRSAPVKRTASYYARSSELDKKRKVTKPYGKRKSASGKVYYETRRNHTDRYKKKRY